MDACMTESNPSQLRLLLLHPFPCIYNSVSHLKLTSMQLILFSKYSMWALLRECLKRFFL